MPTNYWNILALSAVIFLACSLSPTPVYALSLDNTALHARHAHIGQALAKRAPRRCQARPSSAGGNTTPATSPASSQNLPKPTTTSAPPPPVSTPASGGKAGLAYSGDADIAAILRNFKTSHVSTIYNWNSYKIEGAAKAGIEYAAMLWGARPDDISNWQKNIVRGYARYALGFNEPDHKGQAEITPATAVGIWNQRVKWLNTIGYYRISPATTSGPNGILWMQEFLRLCGGDCVDAIAVHWYGTSATEFIEYLKKWHNTFNKPIWVTEFACMDFVTWRQCPDVFAFAGTVRTFMDNTPWVERYFPFVIGHNMRDVNTVNRLLNADNTPTNLAWAYFG